MTSISKAPTKMSILPSLFTSAMSTQDLLLTILAKPQCFIKCPLPLFMPNDQLMPGYHPHIHCPHLLHINQENVVVGIKKAASTLPGCIFANGSIRFNKFALLRLSSDSPAGTAPQTNRSSAIVINVSNCQLRAFVDSYAESNIVY